MRQLYAAYGNCNAKDGKPVNLRHGRATVIGGLKRQSESQTLLWHADRNGTRNPKEPNDDDRCFCTFR